MVIDPDDGNLDDVLRLLMTVTAVAPRVSTPAPLAPQPQARLAQPVVGARA